MSDAPKLDRIDRKILHELMRDVSFRVSQLAERVGLQQTPCWKAGQKLQTEPVGHARVDAGEHRAPGQPRAVNRQIWRGAAGSWLAALSAM